MVGDKYLISDQNGLYFTTSTIFGWIDIFTRISFREMITKSLNYCVSSKFFLAGSSFQRPLLSFNYTSLNKFNYLNR